VLQQFDWNSLLHTQAHAPHAERHTATLSKTQTDKPVGDVARDAAA